jgi:hypothetical protein
MREKESHTTSPEELADLPEDFWDDAETVTPPPTEAICIRIDEDALEWSRDQLLFSVTRQLHELIVSYSHLPGPKPAPPVAGALFAGPPGDPPDRRPVVRQRRSR